MSDERAPSSLRTAGAVLLAWGAVSLGAALQVVVAARLDGRTVGFGAAWLRHLPILVLWALATPAILASARRFPVRGPGAPGAAAVHLAAGSLFVVGANLLIRLPGLVADGGYPGPAALLADTLPRVVRWFPPALGVYGGIVALGHALSPPGAPGEAPGAGARGDGATASDVPDPGPAPEPGPLGLRTEDGLRLLRAGEMDWVEADGDHVIVHADGDAVRARGRLGELEERLEPHGFVRVHRSALVRLSFIRELRPRSHGDMVVVLKSGESLPLPRGRRSELQERLGLSL